MAENTPSSEPAVPAIGSTAHFISGGVEYSGVVLDNQSQLASALPNQGGGEPIVLVSVTIGNKSVQAVRASECF